MGTVWSKLGFKGTFWLLMEIILSGAREEARRVAGRLFRSPGEGGLGEAGCVGSSSGEEGFWSKKLVNGWSDSGRQRKEQVCEGVCRTWF